MSLYNVKCLLCDKKRQDEETFSEIDPLRQFFCAFFLNSNILLAKKKLLCILLRLGKFVIGSVPVILFKKIIIYAFHDVLNNFDIA